MTGAISAVIADDEALARTNIREALRSHSRWSVVAEVSSGHDVGDAVELHRPDVIFLDIRMPGRNGIEVARALASTPYCPLIVFATAFDRYAVQAFELCAFDYLLKPFDDDRFDRVVARAEAALRGDRTRDLRELADHLEDPNRRITRLLIRSIGSIRVVPIEDVRWFAASGNYVEVHHRNGHELHRVQLSSLEAKLDQSAFCRVHRSAVVRVSEVREVRLKQGEAVVAVMSDGTEVRVSARYRERLLTALAGASGSAP